MLNVEELKIAYNGKAELVQVLNGISLSIKEGESVGIVGESGSGKSQTALSVLKLIQGRPGITGGRIYFDNMDLINYSEDDMRSVRGHQIAIIFQDARASLIPYLTIRDQVFDTYKSLANGRSKDEILTDAATLLEEMNFSDPEKIMSSFPNQLSGGECQRAYIMLALLGRPKLLIADEPTSSLDPVTSEMLIDLLKGICSRRKIAFILISHDLGEIIRVTDYVYVFYNGYIIEEFPAAWVRDKKQEPVHPYSRFLFSMYKGTAFADLKNGKKNSDLYTPRMNGSNSDVCGCIYEPRCRLKPELDAALQIKCENMRPEPEQVISNSRVACWAANQIVQKDA